MSALGKLSLSHYSDKPVTEVLSKKQESQPQMKPHGFWLSVNGERDWKEWCEAEEFNLSTLAIKCVVTLKPKANVLHIKTMKELRDFDEAWGASLIPGRMMDVIYWNQVVRKWDGIIIAPYQYEFRFTKLWYYGWDCANGCIWNARAIAEISVA